MEHCSFYLVLAPNHVHIVCSDNQLVIAEIIALFIKYYSNHDKLLIKIVP